jgi:hypothetical protein
LTFTADNWNQIIEHSGLIYLDVSSRLNSPKPLNDTARIHSRVDKAENGVSNGLSQNYTGKGVVVGIVDIGFQTDHPTFYSPDGKSYRIQRFWNQQKVGSTRCYIIMVLSIRILLVSRPPSTMMVHMGRM